MVKLKFILKALLCAVILTSGAQAKFDDKIYLLPRNHDDTVHLSLAARIAEKAKGHNVILGIEAIDHDSGIDYDLQCIETGFCDLKKSDQRYFVKMESPLASAITHLIYFYTKLIMIQAWEQFANYSKQSTIQYNAKETIHSLWYNDLGLPALFSAFLMILSSDVAYQVWDSVAKGPLMQNMAEDLKLLRAKCPKRPLEALNNWPIYMEPEIKFPYTKERVKGLVQELPILIERLTRQLLEQEAVVGMPYDFEQKLFSIIDTLLAARPVGVSSWQDLKLVVSNSNIISDNFGDRLRNFFMAQNLMNLYKTAKKLKVPLVASIGYGHVMGIYEFLKLNEFDVEVGMKENVLNLDDASFRVAQSCNMKYVAEANLKENIKYSLGNDVPDDFMNFLIRFKDTDPQILEAYEFVIGDEQELSEHDEL